MRKSTLLTFFTFLMLALQPILASDGIGITFVRTGTDASSVSVTISDENGTTITGAAAVLTTSHSLKATSNNVTEQILCPDINGNQSPTIELTLTMSGLPSDFTFNNVNLDIHALNGGSNYQESNDGAVRQFNVLLEQGGSSDNLSEFGTLSNIDIAAGVNPGGYRHKVWSINGEETVVSNGVIVLKLTITKGETNSGCFFGLSEITLSTNSTPDPEPTPTPDESGSKIYNISWKNTGANYMTEGANKSISVSNYDVTKRQFWMLIPTGKENCYYIKNTATGNYIGSCNKTPSSASRINTQSTPVEYYIAPTAATSGEIAGCHYLSSTDCGSYSSESAGPRALNKDGASEYVITWQAGTSRVGSYWKLIETTDLYEFYPYEASDAIGTIGTKYNIESRNGSYLTVNEGILSLTAPDLYNDNQEWYFVGTKNNPGWQIAWVASPAVTIGVSNESFIASESNTGKWAIKASKEEKGYYYFTSKEDENVILTIDGESLFKFNKLRSIHLREQQIYNNPCGFSGGNYIKSLTVKGEEVLDRLSYNATSAPAGWHVIYSLGKGCVAIGKEFTIEMTLSSTPADDLLVNAYFDWNCDGVFETTQPITLNGTEGTCTVNVPTWAAEKQSRMRVRVNQSGLDLAEDDVEGFVYDFNISVAQPQSIRTVKATVNESIRGTVSLSEKTKEYAYGTELTATATAIGNSTFICWREGNNVVSTDATYKFTVDHNIELIAYFSPNTDEDSWTNITQIPASEEIAIEQHNNTLIISATGNVKSFALYTTNATLVAKTSNCTMNTSNLNEGVYIARIVTDNGYRNLKIYIKK